MNELVEKLLQPVKDDLPCGPDLSNSPSYGQLETLAKGKPEVELGTVVRAAEPPDWRDLSGHCVKFLGESKHLSVAVMLLCAWLRTRGWEGLRDGLELVRGLLERYWDTVYPLLDPEDNLDPTRRLSILRTLTAERGTISGWLTVVDYLHTTPVCQPKGAPPISLDHLLAARKAEPGAAKGSKQWPDAAQLAAAFRDTGNEALAALQQAVNDALKAAHAIDNFLTATLGAGNTISFEVLQGTLDQLLMALASFSPGAGATLPTPAVPGASLPETTPSINLQIAGPVRSREEVVKAIDGICAYYRQVEPSSPVPYLLRRAKKLATMDFIQAMQELNLANLETLRPSLGTALDPTSDPSQPPSS